MKNRFERFSNKNKKMIIKGSGKFMAQIPGCAELITLGSMTNMRLDIQLDMVDIEGGDTATPIDTLLRKKVIDITAEDAKFDLNMVRLVLGSKLREGVSGKAYELKVQNVVAEDDGDGVITASVSSAIGDGVGMPDIQAYNQTMGGFVNSDHITGTGTEILFADGVSDGDKVVVYYPIANSIVDPDGFVWVLEEKHTIANNELELNSPLFSSASETKTSHVSVRLIHENKLLNKTTSPTPGEKEYYIDTAANKIIFNEYLDELDVYVNYKRPEVVDVLDIGSNDFPLTVHVVHDGMFEQKDNSIQGYQTELYMCRVKSNFTLDAARQQAATHSVTLTVVDPERTDGKLGTIKRYQIPASSVDC